MVEEDPAEEDEIRIRKPTLRAKQQSSSSEAPKQKVASTSSSTSSYLTLKPHLLLMNAPPASKSNKYKRSHSSISNPETKQKEQEEEEIHSPEKSSKSAPIQGDLNIKFLLDSIGLRCTFFSILSMIVSLKIIYLRGYIKVNFINS